MDLFSGSVWQFVEHSILLKINFYIFELTMESTKKAGLNLKRFNYVKKLVIDPRLEEVNSALAELIDVSAKHPRENFV